MIQFCSMLLRKKKKTTAWNKPLCVKINTEENLKDTFNSTKVLSELFKMRKV